MTTVSDQELQSLMLEAASRVPFDADPSVFDAMFDKLLWDLLEAKGLGR